MLEREQVRGDGVGERDPAPPLAAAPDPSAPAELERVQQPLERAAVAGEDEPWRRWTVRARGARGLGGGLPRLDDLGQEASAGRRALVDDLVAAVAVEPGRRRAEERPACRAAGGSLGEEPRAVDAGLEHALRAVSSVQRCPMFSPARCTIAPTSCERAVVDRAGRRCPTGPRPAPVGARRTRRTTSWPAASSAWQSAVPIRPEEPVIATAWPSLYKTRTKTRAGALTETLPPL